MFGSSVVALLVSVEQLLRLGIPESVATHGVDDDEGHEGHHQDHIAPLPFSSEVGYEAGFAGRARVAKHRLIVAPQHAVDVGRGADGADPVGRVHKCVSALRRWLAAP